MPDTILIVASEDAKLKAFLKKMGHQLLISDDGMDLAEQVAGQIVDLVILEGSGEDTSVELCSFLRTEEVTKEVPILFVSHSPLQASEIKERGVDLIEYIDSPYSVGSMVSRVATMLRLRKFAGREEEKASLGEVNAALRDLNERFKKELEEARHIQQGLLPKSLPKDDRFDMAASYEPLEEVGGDWFFIEKKSSGKIAVQIADVTGHGLSAAFIGSMTKLAMVAANKELPNELLEEMNRLMAPQIPDGKFVTMFSYLYDPESGHLHYARGGHPPGLLLKRAEGEVLELKGDVFAVGFFEEGMYTAEESQMAPGDILVVMTDALPEGQNMSGEYYGFERMSNLMKNSSPDISCGKLLKAIIQDFETFRDGRVLKDDTTLIALKRTK
ncbi:MAG: SpoIIE family protein phosphatase [Bdellovibrionales bacterium]|nr:SpoIIE family protein phosphatase [Bdellovibrionales bacterium]